MQLNRVDSHSLLGAYSRVGDDNSTRAREFISAAQTAFASPSASLSILLTKLCSAVLSVGVHNNDIYFSWA